MDKERLKELEKKAAPKKWKGDNFPFDIKHCPGYEGYKPENLTHEGVRAIFTEQMNKWIKETL